MKHHQTLVSVPAMRRELPGEANAAGRTLEGLLSGVRPHVPWQFSSPVDNLLTDRTLLGGLGLPLPSTGPGGGGPALVNGRCRCGDAPRLQAIVVDKTLHVVVFRQLVL